MFKKHLYTYFIAILACYCILPAGVWAQTQSIRTVSKTQSSFTTRYAIVMPADASAKLKEAAEALTQKHKAEKMDVRTITFANSNLRSALPALRDFKPYYTCYLIPKELAGNAFTVEASRMSRDIIPDKYVDTFWGILTGADDEDIIRLAKFAGPIKIENALDMVGGFSHDVVKRCYSFDETQEQNLRVTDPKENKRNVKTKTNKDFTELYSKLINGGGMQLIMTSGHATENNWASGYLSDNMYVIQNNFGLYARSTMGQVVKLADKTPKIWCAAGNCLIGNVPPGGKSCMVLSAIHVLGVQQFMGYTVETWFGRQGWTAQGMLTEYPGFYDFNQCFHFANSSIVRGLIDLEIADKNIDVSTYDNFIESFNGAEIKIHKHGVDAKEVAGLLYDRDVVAFYGDPAVKAAIEPFNGQTLSLEVKHSANSVKLTVKTLKDGSWHGTGLYLPYDGAVFSYPIVRSRNFQADVTPCSCFAYIDLKGDYKKGETLEILIEETGDTTISSNNTSYAELKTWINAIPANSIPKDIMLARFETACSKLPEDTIKELAAKKSTNALVNAYTAWLISVMPDKDLRDIDISRIHEDIAYAIKVRGEVPWRTQINEDLFLRYILPYWGVNEARDPWRKFFYTKFMSTVKNCRTPSDAVKKLNDTVFKELDVTYNAEKRPKPDQSAMESIKAHYASCTGLSVILINACRACGIPARFVGCALWTDQSGNHSWVEFWDNQWIYEGASASDPRNRSWVGDKVKAYTSSTNAVNDVWATTTEQQPDKSHFILTWQTADTSYPAVSTRQFYLEQDMVRIKLAQEARGGKNIWLYYKGEPWFRLTPTEAAKGIELPASVFPDLQSYCEADAPGTFKTVQSPVK